MNFKNKIAFAVMLALVILTFSIYKILNVMQKEEKHNLVLKDSTEINDQSQLVAGNPIISKNEGTEQRFYFFDDFSDNRNDWDNVNNVQETLPINGKLRIKGKGEYMFQSSKKFNIDISKDFSFSVTVKWIGGVANSDFGIRFCSDYDKESYIDFSISVDRFYNIAYMENDSDWKYLVDWKEPPFPINGRNSNILCVKKKGAYFLFYINGQFVKKLTNIKYFGNAFGVKVDGLQTVDFDDFKLVGVQSKNR